MSASLTPPFLAPWSDPAPPRVMVRHLRPRTAERPAVPAMPRGPCAARGPRGELGGAPRHASVSGRWLSRAVSGSVQPTVAEAPWALHSVSRARGRSASIHRRARDPSCGAALRHRPDEGVIGIAPTRADDVRRRDAGVTRPAADETTPSASRRGVEGFRRDARALAAAAHLAY